MKKLILALLLIAPLNLKASIYHWKFAVEMDEKSIADGESKFKVEDWNCTVGDVTTAKVRTEIRRLGCGLGEGLQAFLNISCYKDLKTGKVRSDGGVLNLQMRNSAAKMVYLTCY